MNKIQTLSAALVAAALAVSTTAYAQDAIRNGEHPAVIVKRMQASQGYDYAAQFYAHPAGLALSSDMPHTMNDHPAVTLARRAGEPKAYDYAAQFYAHPAGFALLAEAPRERGDHPAVLIARRAKQQTYDYAAQFYAHPAGLALSTAVPATANTILQATTATIATTTR